MLENNVWRRVIVCLLALVMVLSCLTLSACKPKSGTQDTPVNPNDPSGPDDPQEQRIPLDLPERNFGGMEFHVLEWTTAGNETPGGSNWLPWEEIAVSEEDKDVADVIGTAVWDRNLAVSEKYGVEITREYCAVNDNKFVTAVTNNDKTGDDAYQMITIRTIQTPSLMQGNYLLNLRDEAYSDIFHFDQPWWVQDALGSFRLGDALYIASSEILVRDKGATTAMYFNQNLAENFGIRDLYDLVRTDDWTLEKLLEYSAQVTHDDGDDQMNGMGDTWGMTGGNDVIFYLFNGFGQKFADMDESGRLQWKFGDNTSVTKIKDVFDFVMYDRGFANLAIKAEKESKEWYQLFSSGHALFDFGLIKDVRNRRSMEDNYGILPVPKYDTAQKDYSSLVWMHHDCVLGIPRAVSDPEMCAMIVEALSYESYYTVYPAFYDVVLMGRSTRDNDSKEMLNYIFNSRSYDPGQFLDTSSFVNRILLLTSSGTSDVTSLWKSYETEVTQNVVKKLNDWIDKQE